MASHLTITAKPQTGASTTKGFNPQNGSEADNGATGTFAAMLGNTQKVPDAKGTAEAKPQTDAEKLIALALGTDNDKDAKTGAANDNPDAVAAVIDATQPIQLPDEAKALLTDLVKGLAALKQALDAGETVDPKLLGRINADLEGLAAKFNIDLSTHPTLKDLTELTASIKPAQADATAQLTTALAPLAQAMLAGQAGPSPAPELPAAVTAIGEKLVALLKSLNTDGVTAGDKAALGLQTGSSNFDADLKAAIAKLVNPLPKVDAGQASPALAEPTLKLTEPALTGKAEPGVPTTAPQPAADTAPKASTADQAKAAASPAVALDPTPNATADKKPSDDRKPADDKLAAPIPAAAANDTRTDIQANAASTQPAARVDVAAPRVVQAGYQTSQQQLNLPQLAFELVRQVTDGNTRFQMRLDPPELGRIDVKLDIDKSGHVNARLVVEKSETLDLMQRDQRALERALQQAGLDNSKTSLEFSLKQSPFSGGQQQARDQQTQQFSLDSKGLDDIEEAPPIVNLYRASLSASGVNIIA